MESLLFLLKGILIGLLFGVPVGAVGTMTVSRTLNHGFGAGIITGLGSSVADCIYAGVGAFGLTLVSDFLLKYETVIHLLGGCLVITMGISAFFRKQKSSDETRPAGRKLPMFFSAFAVGITNPAAILTFLFAFSYFDLSAGMNAFHGILLVSGVLLGTLLWWLTLSGVAVRLRERAVKHRTMLNRIFGSLLILFGFIIFISSIR